MRTKGKTLEIQSNGENDGDVNHSGRLAGWGVRNNFGAETQSLFAHVQFKMSVRNSNGETKEEI